MSFFVLRYKTRILHLFYKTRLLMQLCTRWDIKNFLIFVGVVCYHVCFTIKINQQSIIIFDEWGLFIHSACSSRFVFLVYRCLQVVL